MEQFPVSLITNNLPTFVHRAFYTFEAGINGEVYEAGYIALVDFWDLLFCFLENVLFEKKREVYGGEVNRYVI